MNRNIDFNNIRKIHFIGVGGIGVSALARFFLHEKKEVSGSDRSPSEITEALQKEGVHFFEEQVAENITDDIDLVVYTEAMPDDHEELTAARNKGIPTINYFTALGLVSNQYYLIAVAGTHGKTTTTAMITDILEDAGFDPTAIVGSLRAKTGSNFRAGKSKYAVVEACEYRRDFLALTPDVLVITNIEAEHLDYYKDLKDVQSAFHELASQVHEDGVIVANLADSNVFKVLNRTDLFKQVGPVKGDSRGIMAKVIDYGKYFDPTLKLNQPGIHNQMNAAAAKAVALHLGVGPLNVRKSLENFSGTWRRFEYKGELNGAKIYDDYAHHPTEISATLKGMKELFPDKKILLVYQPHLDSRTEKLFDDFVQALGGADELILNPAYAARAVGGSHDSTKRLAEVMESRGVSVTYMESFNEIEEEVKKRADGNKVVLVMGAGDIAEVANMLV